MATHTILMDGFSDWELKPEGLCRGDTCVPVRNDDFAAIGAALGRPVLVDDGAEVVAIGEPAADRRRALTDHTVPSFELPDLDGAMRQIAEWRGRTKLLVAFASW